MAITRGGTLDNRNGKLNAQRLRVEAQDLCNQGGAIEQTGVQALVLKADAASNRSNGLLGALDAVASGGNERSPGCGTSPGSGGGTPGTGEGNGGSTGTRRRRSCLWRGSDRHHRHAGQRRRQHQQRRHGVTGCTQRSRQKWRWSGSDCAAGRRRSAQ
ncbi:MULTISPECIES: hypothetical protein [Stenotrophomonas]|uniref:hypothetical protein n=1 Tax=Stenotrophomonas maltophilia TaxID=40324 RepID=UPI001E5CD9CD|nr:hypothetical protein [Stenotrophomonas maltophilia]